MEYKEVGDIAVLISCKKEADGLYSAFTRGTNLRLVNFRDGKFEIFKGKGAEEYISFEGRDIIYSGCIAKKKFSVVITPESLFNKIQKEITGDANLAIKHLRNCVCRQS
jgi:hypothetical protein